MDFKSLAAALKQKQPAQVQNNDFDTGMNNLKNAAQGIDPVAPVPSLQGSGPVTTRYPGQTSDGDYMSDQVVDMQAQNLEKAKSDPVTADRLAAMQRAIEQHRAQQEETQLQQLQGFQMQRPIR